VAPRLVHFGMCQKLKQSLQEYLEIAASHNFLGPAAVDSKFEAGDSKSY